MFVDLAADIQPVPLRLGQIRNWTLTKSNGMRSPSCFEEIGLGRHEDGLGALARRDIHSLSKQWSPAVLVLRRVHVVRLMVHAADIQGPVRHIHGVLGATPRHVPDDVVASLLRDVGGTLRDADATLMAGPHRGRAVVFVIKDPQDRPARRVAECRRVDSGERRVIALHLLLLMSALGTMAELRDEVRMVSPRRAECIGL